jgi:hypothetical protein
VGKKPTLLNLMLTTIKRQDCLSRYAIFPPRSYDYQKDEEKLFYPEVFRSYVLTLPSRSFRGHARALSMELTKLVKALDASALIFLGDTRTSWLGQDNDYKPVKEALQYLAGNKIGKRFNGAIQVPAPELPLFVRHLAWLSRCNAALPYIYFTTPDKNILGTICQYGSLHLDALNEEADKLITSFVDGSRFQYGGINSCTGQFNKTRAIPGRQIVV